VCSCSCRRSSFEFFFGTAIRAGERRFAYLSKRSARAAGSFAPSAPALTSRIA